MRVSTLSLQTSTSAPMDLWSVTVEPLASTYLAGITASVAMATMTTECSQPMESHVKVTCFE